MQSFSPTSADRRPRLLVVELWGLGDVALAVPFLRAAAREVRVTLLAKPHAAPLLRRFCPEVELLPWVAPWTAFRGKYQFTRWPWRELATLVRALQARRFDAVVSARPDPRDHALMVASSAGLRAGFSRAGSGLLLTERLARPEQPHRGNYWESLAARFGWSLAVTANAPREWRHLVIHTGAAQPTRTWPRERFERIASRLRGDGWQVTMLDGDSGSLDELVAQLATADRFLGNDSGPGHVAALLGVPTFTIFGAQEPEFFHPIHPLAAWERGAPCVYKPCHDSCRFGSPHCIQEVSVETVWASLTRWLAQIQ